MIDYRQISSETLKNLGLEKGTDVVKLSIVLTELSLLLKLSGAFTYPMPEIKEKENDKEKVLIKANLEIVTIINFLTVGKLVEAWKMVDSERFNTDYLESISEDGREHFEILKNYFSGKKKALKSIRNEIAFHYHRDFQSHFYDDVNGIRFPDINMSSNFRMNGTTIFSDIYMFMATGDFKREQDLEWIKLHDEIKEFAPRLMQLMYDLIKHIVGDELSEVKIVEIPDLESGDTILTNYFWELPFMRG